MPKQKLFDEDSEEEVTLKTENEYAKKYDTWREKEEIHKLEQKYGSKALNSDGSISSDSEDESDEPPEVSEEVEEQFLKTLALLKTQDPRIYDPSYKFFEEKQKEEVKEAKKKTLTFADSDDDDDDDDDGNIFSIEKKAEINDTTRHKDTDKKEGKLKDFLTGKVDHIDAPVERDLAPLKALWSDPQLNEGEAFLRDYILNKRYLEDGGDGGEMEKIRDDAELEEDEQMVEEQGKFERAYNFRFEEPDQEYLKRFPRTMNSIRPKDDRRSKKRAEIRDRKEEEKRRKMEEIARLKALKLKEIQEKIAKIKQVTGNEELAFKEDDIEGDFDPEEHDRRMKAIFDEQFYGDADDEKPVFPDLDEELEIENWDKYEPEHERNKTGDSDDDGPHCEDDDFNMDADYNPRQARATLLQEIQSTLGKKRRNRKKKSKLAKLLSTDKPKFIPEDTKTYDQYMEEYYNMDCEDVIGGDLPTRFKYREVVPNDYGLTVEEILLADDKELTQWVPLKKLVKHRPESVQKSEVNTYRQKAADLSLKKKMLPSLFKDLPQEPELVVPTETKKKKKKRKNKSKALSNAEDNEHRQDDVADQIAGATNENNHNNSQEEQIENTEEIQPSVGIDSELNGEATGNDRKKKKHKSLHDYENINTTQEKVKENTSSIENGETSNTVKKKNKNKKQKLKSDLEIKTHEKQENKIDKNEISQNGDVKLIKEITKKNKKDKGFQIEEVINATPSQASELKQIKQHKLKRKAENGQHSEIPSKKKKNNTSLTQNKKSKNVMKFKKQDKFKNKQNNNDKSSDNPLSKLSDERLKAYGLNPKKYRSFLKYKKF